MQTMIINNCEVELLAVRSKIFTTSRQIAEVFEKRHADILRIIDKLPNDEFRKRNFALTERTAKFGAVERTEQYYKITKDGFALLVMGFTGERAYKWKIEYIKAFNLMQEELLKRSRRKSESGQRAKIAAKNRKIALLKRQMANQNSVVKTQKSDVSYENLKALYHNTLLDCEFFKKRYKEKELKERAIGEALSRINGHVKSLIDYIYD